MSGATRFEDGPCKRERPQMEQLEFARDQISQPSDMQPQRDDHGQEAQARRQVLRHEPIARYPVGLDSRRVPVPSLDDLDQA